MDTRTWSRRFGATSLIVGPAALAVGTLLGTDAETAKAQLSWATTHQTQAHIGDLVGLPTLLIVPASIYLMRLARRGSPKLAMVGGFIAATAWLAGLIGLAPESTVVEYAARMPDRAAATTFVSQLEGNVTISTLEGLFVLGHLVGMLLLGIALYRSRSIPRAAAVVIAISPILHAAGMALSPLADAATFGLMAVGTAVAGWCLLHVDNDEWDLPAAPARPTKTAPVLSPAAVAAGQ